MEGGDMSWCGDSGGTHKTHIMWIEWFKLASYLGPVNNCYFPADRGGKASMAPSTGTRLA